MDRPAFTRLLYEHKDAVYGLAVHLLRSREEAEDVVQDVFLKLWRQGERVEAASCGVWLMRVCRNACLDRLRRRRVRSRHRDDPLTTTHGLHAPAPGEEGMAIEGSVDLSDGGAGARHIEREVEVHEVVQAMGDLDEPHRSVIMLRELHHLSYEEIAEVTGLSLSSVKITLHRARKSVRRRLEQPWEARA